MRSRDAVPGDEFDMALMRLYSDRPELQERGIETLLSAGPAGLRALFADDRRVSWSDALGNLGRGCLTVTLLLFGIPMVGFGLIFWSSAGSPWAIVGLGLVGIGVSTGRQLSKRTASRTEMVLSRVEDVRCVQVLLDHLYSPNGRWNSETARALTRVLPGLKASDSGLISKRNRRMINDLLRTSPFHNKLTVALMEALKQVGDDSTLDVLNEILIRRGFADDRMQRLALDTMDFLRARLDHEKVSGTLLRAAQVDVEPPLLRPAESAQSDDKGRLLRPEE